MPEEGLSKVVLGGGGVGAKRGFRSPMGRTTGGVEETNISHTPDDPKGSADMHL